MSDSRGLLPQRLVEFSLAMSMNVAPQRRDCIEVALPVHIDQVITLTALDYDWLVVEPCTHLRERMPQISMVRVLEFFVSLILHPVIPKSDSVRGRTRRSRQSPHRARRAC